MGIGEQKGEEKVGNGIVLNTHKRPMFTIFFFERENPLFETFSSVH